MGHLNLKNHIFHDLEMLLINIRALGTELVQYAFVSNLKVLLN